MSEDASPNRQGEILTLLEIAHIYTDLVNADSEIPDSEYHAKDLISTLRTKYHNMLMEQMQTEGI